MQWRYKFNGCETMKIVVPNYYKEFQCIASACRHSCCIGWEIDIDPATYSYYSSIGGDIGERLKECTTVDDGQAHFFWIKMSVVLSLTVTDFAIS